MTATDTALGTAELLEEILMRLPFLEVIRKQRVCRTWRDCTRNSIRIQRKLFRVATDTKKAPKVAEYSFYSCQPVKVNPLLANVFRIRRSENSGSSATLVAPKDKGKLQNVRQKENVLRTRSSRDSASQILRDIHDRPIILGSRKFYGKSTRRPSLGMLRRQFGFKENETREAMTASNLGVNGCVACGGWADMLVSQPALPVLSVRIQSNPSTYTTTHCQAKQVIASDGVGVRLGELVQAVAHLYKPSCGLFDPEFEIFQQLEVIRGHPCFQRDERGGILYLDWTADEHYLRAWRTRVKGNFG